MLRRRQAGLTWLASTIAIPSAVESEKAVWGDYKYKRDWNVSFRDSKMEIGKMEVGSESWYWRTPNSIMSAPPASKANRMSTVSCFWGNPAVTNETKTASFWREWWERESESASRKLEEMEQTDACRLLYRFMILLLFPFQSTLLTFKAFAAKVCLIASVILDLAVAVRTRQRKSIFSIPTSLSSPTNFAHDSIHSSAEPTRQNSIGKVLRPLFRRGEISIERWSSQINRSKRSEISIQLCRIQKSQGRL